VNKWFGQKNGSISILRVSQKKEHRNGSPVRLASTINDMTGWSQVCCEDFGLFAELEPLLVCGHQLQQREVVHTLHLYQRQCLR
jgi:hypothetical protein